MARPLFQRPCVFSMRGLGLGTRVSYTASYMRRAAVRVKHAKNSEFEKRLHRCETGAEDPNVHFKGGRDAETDEIIWEYVSCVTSVKFLGSLTSKVGRVLVDGNSVQAESSCDNVPGKRPSASCMIPMYTGY